MEGLICPKCNFRKRPNKGRKPNGEKMYRKYCDTCSGRISPERKKYRNKQKGWRLRGYAVHKKNYCEKCGFVAEHRCQLDVDHIDGNHKNNEVSNLQTLCANCHRLKTYKNKDWESNKKGI